MKKIKYLLICLLCVGKLFSQSGDIYFGFDPGLSTENTIHDADVMANGKLLIGGSFTTYQGVTSKALVLVNQHTGAIDMSFISPFNAVSDLTYINEIRALPNGKVLVNGMTQVSGAYNHFLYRINSDGSLDSSFSVLINGSVFDILVEDNGKILITGNFSTVNGVSRNGIARLNATGTLDTTFNPGLGLNSANQIYSIKKLPAGKYIAGGLIGSYNTVTTNNLIRLNSNGSLDTSYNGWADNTIADISILAEDKIIISGSFTMASGATANSIARLDSGGNYDATFVGNITPTVATSATGLKHKVLPDGQIIIYSSESFNSPSVINIRGLARLNSRGSLDLSFNSGFGFGQTSGFLSVNKVLDLPTGNLIAVGWFNSYNGSSVKNVVQIGNKIETASGSYCFQLIDRITATSLVNPSGRVYTDGVYSSCASPKTFPGVSAVGNCSYKTYNAINYGSLPQCVSFHLKTQSTNSWLIFSAYNGSYNPANMSQNYIGGFGGSATLGNDQSCSIQINPGQSIVLVVSENNPDATNANGDYILSIDGLCNFPTVRVAPLNFLEYTSKKPVAYFSVKFNMPILGFTNSDIIINSDTGANKAFIKDTGLTSNGKDYIVGVTGMQKDGFVDIKIPAFSVSSGDEGTSNLESIHSNNFLDRSKSQIKYALPTLNCQRSGSEGEIKSMNDITIYNTPGIACNFNRNYLIDNGVFNTRVHSFENKSGVDKCVGVKIKKAGGTTYWFNVFKDFIPTNVSNYLTQWIAGPDDIGTTYNGNCYSSSYFSVANNQKIYVQVMTTNTDYDLIFEDALCSDLQNLATENFEIDNTSVNIYPNPSQSIFNISSEGKIEKVKILNLLGQTIIETNTNSFNLSKQEAGIYLVEISLNGKKIIKRIIKK